MKYLLIILAMTALPSFAQDSKARAIKAVHKDLGIKRVGYGYKLMLEKRPKLDVYKFELEENDEQALAQVSERFRFAVMSEDQIEDEVRRFEVKAWQDRKAYQDEKDETKKAELKKAMDASAKIRNEANYFHRMTAQLGPIFHRITGPDKQFGNVLEEFWFNHFNVSMKSQRSVLGYRRMIRSKVDSTFYDLLLSTAKHPAMLNYLDLRTSRKGRLNENYAREVLELHTLGDEDFVYYDQKDIVGVANILSGWAYERKMVESLDVLRFSFQENQNEPAAQSVLKEPHIFVSSEGASLEKGEMLLKHLANHPATKENLCKKLHKWFIGGYDDIAVSKCMEAWGVDGDLKAIYKSMLTVEDIQRNYSPKDRNPFELVIARERLLKNEISWDYLKRLHDEMKYLGLNYSDIAPPTGYKDVNKQMTSSRLVSWIKSSVTKLEPSPEVSQHLLQNYGEERGFNPAGRYLKAIGDRSLVSRKKLAQSIYQPFIDRKNNEADVYATFSFKTITSPAFMRK